MLPSVKVFFQSELAPSSVHRAACGYNRWDHDGKSDATETQVLLNLVTAVQLINTTTQNNVSMLASGPFKPKSMFLSVGY